VRPSGPLSANSERLRWLRALVFERLSFGNGVRVYEKSWSGRNRGGSRGPTPSLNFLLVSSCGTQQHTKEAMHLASGVTERAVKLEWRIIDLAKLVGQGLRRSKTCRSFTHFYFVRWLLSTVLLQLAKRTL
jgi:hypothetical protein